MTGIKRPVARRVGLPATAVVEICGMDADGELWARPLAWDGDGPPPRILMEPFRAGRIALGLGDHVLARLRRLGHGQYEGRPIKRLTDGPARILGVFERNGDGSGRIRGIDRRQKADLIVAAADSAAADSGELVLAEILPGRPFGLKPARVMERLGGTDGAGSISLVAIHAFGIPDCFSREAVLEAEAAEAAPAAGREDLRAIPLVTIDGADARDFDDAVWAEPDGAGWHLLVAIADVAWYVRPLAALDREAFERGNSVYFPDRVVPMLPEVLSNGWCSLKPGEDRPCLAVHVWIDDEGRKIRHRFLRGVMRSAARLTYEQVQAAQDGRPDDAIARLPGGVVASLYGAWRALFRARKERGALELEIPERKVVIGADGGIEAVVPRPVLDSHRLIEEFMIAANVAAAEEIEASGLPCMYRIHALPSDEKLRELHDFLATLGLSLPLGQVIRPAMLNALLDRARVLPEARLVHETVLRAQAQAVYAPGNIGHFGLGLARYAHFTSPIRRYADLLVHRALIAGLGLGEGGLPCGKTEETEEFAGIAQHISATERRAAAAERDAVDRFCARFLMASVGARFAARINGVTRSGLFVTLDETGADGFVPVSSLADDFYSHDKRRHRLIGRRLGKSFALGDGVDVVLREAEPLTGSLVFTLVGEDAAVPGAPEKAKSDAARRGRVQKGRGRAKGKTGRRSPKRP